MSHALTVSIQEMMVSLHSKAFAEPVLTMGSQTMRVKSPICTPESAAASRA